jgi:thiamine-monophosphate kinase
MVLRTSARPGDLVCVTGTIGDAALGLALRARAQTESAEAERDRWAAALDPDQRAFLLDRYLHPQPRVALRQALRDHARAAMDVSDGLAGDLAKMLRVSGVTAEIDADRIPFSPAARAAMRAAPKLFERAVTGGDDYEILCMVAPDDLSAFNAAAEQAGVQLTVIGRVLEGSELPLFRQDGREQRFAAGSFSHF